MDVTYVHLFETYVNGRLKMNTYICNPKENLSKTKNLNHTITLMKHFLFYLITLTVCLPFASCSDEFVELPYAYDEISYRRGYDLDIPLETVIYIESQAEFDQLFADEETKPEASVPFSDGVLTVVKGIANGGIVDLQKNLIQSDDGYHLSIRIRTDFTDFMETWYVAYVIPKEYANKVDLDIEYIN